MKLDRRIAAVVLAAAFSLPLYMFLARLAPGNGWRDVLLFLGAMAALFAIYGAAFASCERAATMRPPLLAIVIPAALFRLALIPAGLPRDTPLREVVPLLQSDLRGSEVVFEHQLLFDDDHWRYLWDGHVTAAGIDPYRFAPDDAHLDPLAPTWSVWSDIRGQVNHPSLTTIYPPLVQQFFRALHAVAPGSVVALKVALIAIDLLTILLISRCVALLGRSPGLVLLYAWNPLAIKVTAGSAHFDSLVAFAVALLTYGVVRNERLVAAAGWVIATGIKLTPLLFFLPVARRLGVVRSVAAVLAIALLLVPMVHWPGAGSGAAAFAQEWEFNATFFHLLKALFVPTQDPSWWARLAVGVATIGAAVFAFRRAMVARNAADPNPPRAELDLEQFAAAALVPLAVLLLAGPVLMPWYLIWALPLAAVARELLWFELTAVCQFAFLVMIDGGERPIVLFVEGTLFVLLILRRLVRCKGRQNDVGRATEGATR